MSSYPPESNPYAAPATPSGAGFDLVEKFGSAEAMRRVASGLNLVYWGILIILLAMIGAIVMGAAGAGLAGANGGAFVVGGVSVALLLAGLGAMAGAAIGLVGRFFCLSVPEETGARPLIFAAVSCDVAAIVLSGLQFLIEAGWIRGVQNILSLAATLLFVIFMKRVAQYIQREQLADRAQSLITMSLILFLLLLAMIAGTLVLGPLAGLIGLVAVILGLFVFLRYVRLLVDLRQAIVHSVPA